MAVTIPELPIYNEENITHQGGKPAMHPDQFISKTAAHNNPEQLEQILTQFGAAIITQRGKPDYFVWKFDDIAATYLQNLVLDS